MHLVASFRSLASALLAAGLLVACHSDPVTTTRYTITFDSDGGMAIKPITVPHGEVIARPENPTRKGYVFDGWYAEASRNVLFNFENTPITFHLTLYAKWNVARSSTARLSSFSFEEAENAFTTLHDEERSVKGIIDEATHTITVDPSAYLYNWSPSGLKASFTASPGATVQVSGAAQVSSATPNNFSQPVTYEVVAEDGITKQTYTVTARAQRTLADIPDANFKSYLMGVNIFKAAFVGDRLDVTHSAVTGFTQTIDVGTKDIASLKGVEFFIALERLNCGHNKLKRLALSHNVALDHLDCSNNELTNLYVRQNVNLTILDCSQNQLKALDVSQNTSLLGLSCSGNMGLATLDVMQNTRLVGLTCSNTGLQALNLSKNVALTGLRCENNTLLRLDLLGMRNVPSELVLTGSTGTLTELKVHLDLQNSDVVEMIKADRGAALVVITYDAPQNFPLYTENCADYDPNGNNGAGVCLRQPNP